MFAGCLQIMWAHSHLIRSGGVGYSQIIRAENADVCRSYGLCLQAATSTVQKPGLALPRLPAIFNRQTVDKTMNVANVVYKTTA